MPDLDSAFDMELMEAALAASITIRGSPPSPQPDSVLPEFCGDHTIELAEATEEDKAILIALSHFTGWSADRIVLLIKKVRGIVVTAEQVWDLHRDWFVQVNRGIEVLDETKANDMMSQLRKFGVRPSAFSISLDETPRPVTVKFAAAWSGTVCALLICNELRSRANINKDVSDGPLFPGFTTEAWNKSKEHIESISVLAKYGELTPVEEELLPQFGPFLSKIMTNSLKAWANDLSRHVRTVSVIQSIIPEVQRQIIDRHLELFQNAYEEAFGTMGLNEQIEIDGKMILKTTGAGARFFLNLMMVDRSNHVYDTHERRRQLKLSVIRIGFEEVAISDLPEHSKNCPVCLDPMGAKNPEGVEETAIKLVICCGQILGRLCLMKWLSEVNSRQELKRSCPMCRSEFPDSFLGKLFRGSGLPDSYAGPALTREEREGAPTPEMAFAEMLNEEDRSNFVASFFALARASQRRL